MVVGCIYFHRYHGCEVVVYHGYSRGGEMGMGIGRDESHEACSLTEIQLFFLHKCVNSQITNASFWLISKILKMLIFMIFASVLIAL